MGMYTDFKTDPDIESKTGVVVDYGSFRITLARAGGANKRYEKALEKKSKPHRKAIEAGRFNNSQANGILREVYSETVVLNWETLVDGKFKKGIESPEGGKLLEPTPENIAATFTELPDLFLDIQGQANMSSLYQQTLREDDSKN